MDEWIITETLDKISEKELKGRKKQLHSPSDLEDTETTVYERTSLEID